MEADFLMSDGMSLRDIETECCLPAGWLQARDINQCWLDCPWFAGVLSPNGMPGQNTWKTPWHQNAYHAVYNAVIPGNTDLTHVAESGQTRQTLPVAYKSIVRIHLWCQSIDKTILWSAVTSLGKNKVIEYPLPYTSFCEAQWRHSVKTKL